MLTLVRSDIGSGHLTYFIRQHTSACVGIRQQTSAYVSLRPSHLLPRHSEAQLSSHLHSVCVCERERERASECVCVVCTLTHVTHTRTTERERERERDRDREKGGGKGVWERKRGRELVCPVTCPFTSLTKISTGENKD